MVAPVSSLLVDGERLAALGLDRVERLLRAQCVEAEEGRRQHEHDEEDPPAQALAQGVADHDGDAPHPASSPTASR